VSFLAPIALRLAKEFEPIDRMLQNHDRRIRELTLVRILGGKLFIDKEVDTSGTEVVHSLGHAPIGCIFIKSDATVTYKTTGFNKTSITVTASSGTRTVSLWIF